MSRPEYNERCLMQKNISLKSVAATINSVTHTLQTFSHCVMEEKLNY